MEATTGDGSKPFGEIKAACPVFVLISFMIGGGSGDGSLGRRNCFERDWSIAQAWDTGKRARSRCGVPKAVAEPGLVIYDCSIFSVCERWCSLFFHTGRCRSVRQLAASS